MARSLVYHQRWTVFGLTLAFFAATCLRSPVNAVSQIWTAGNATQPQQHTTNHSLVSFTTVQYSYIVACYNIASLLLSVLVGVLLDVPGMAAPRHLLALCLLASSGCCLATGFARSWAPVAALTGLTGGLGAAAWPVIVKMASAWFPRRSMGAVFAVINCSWLFGDSASKAVLTLALLVSLHQPWPVLFYCAAGFGFLVTFYVLVFLKDSPESLGYSLDADSGRQVDIEAEADPVRLLTFRQKLRRLFVNPMFWLLCVLYFSVRYTRSTLFFWGSEYLSIRLGIDPDIASVGTVFPPIAGGISSLTVGFVYDRLSLKRRYAMIVCCSFLLLSVCVGAFLLDQHQLLSGVYAGTALLCLLQFFVDSIYALPVGVLASKVGGRSLAATASGLIGGSGIVASTGSAFLVGYLSQIPIGFHYIFLSILVAGAVSALLCVIVAVVDLRAEQRRSKHGALPLVSLLSDSDDSYAL